MAKDFSTIKMISLILCKVYDMGLVTLGGKDERLN
jgi:hypothetical protein